jgi:hypothetical protein
MHSCFTEAHDQHGRRLRHVLLERGAEQRTNLDNVFARVVVRAPPTVAAQKLADPRDDDLLAPQTVRRAEAAQVLARVAAPLARRVQDPHPAGEARALRTEFG